jgi:hypothetical protein
MNCTYLPTYLGMYVCRNLPLDGRLAEGRRYFPNPATQTGCPPILGCKSIHCRHLTTIRLPLDYEPLEALSSGRLWLCCIPSILHFWCPLIFSISSSSLLFRLQNDPSAHIHRQVSQFSSTITSLIASLLCLTHRSAFETFDTPMHSKSFLTGLAGWVLVGIVAALPSGGTFTPLVFPE